MSGLRVQNLRKSFADTTSIADINFVVLGGETLVLLGPRGSGKSAILKMIAGLVLPASGQVMLDGQDITFQPAWKRNIGMMFQEHTLYPSLNVGQNIAFPLRAEQLPQGQINERVEDISLQLGLNEKLSLDVTKLSQSDQQRVALARAMIKRPKALLIDQPLGELDTYQRRQLRQELNVHLAKLKATTIYVTDEPQEAISIADQIAIVENGNIEKIDSPRDIYDHPTSISIANTIGAPSMNFLSFHSRLRKGGKTIRLSGAVVAVPEILETPPSPDLILGVWPQDIQISETSKLRGRVTKTDFLGHWQIVHLDTNHGPVKARLPSAKTYAKGESLGLLFRKERLSIFNRETGNVIASAGPHEVANG